MVHRPSDSRLLTNLLSHEKDYSKHLSTLLDTSHGALASFSAYASASAPPVSGVILAVAGSLAGADDALTRYMSAVEEWRSQLVELKDLEDEVGNVMRDREIYVNRLIKASKSQKPTRESLLISQPLSSGSTLSLKSEFSATGKLSAAQAELQACEVHLALKERELDLKRYTTIRDGLSLRCKALVECGWAWGEMGKEGLRALEALADPPLPSSSNTKPLPETGEPPVLAIPAAYAINDTSFPSRILPRRITEEELNGSSADEQDTDVQVVENPRFSTSKNKSESDQNLTRRFSIRDEAIRSDIGPVGTPRERKASVSGGRFFGSLRGIFGHKRDTSPESPRKGRWKSRTDRNLKVIQKDESDDEQGTQTVNVVAPFLKPPTLTPPPSHKRLRKAPTKKKGKEEPVPEDPVKAWVNGQTRLSEEEDKPLQRKRSKRGSKTPIVLDSNGEVTPPSPPRPSSANSTPKRSSSVTLGHDKPMVKAQRRAATMSWQGEHKESLMSIVEGVAKQNRDERDRSVGGSIKAPPSKSRTELEEELVITPPSPKPVTPSPKPIVANGPSTAGPSGLHHPVPRKAAAAPLRSALKNPSRTPSPLLSPRPTLKREPSPLRPSTPPAANGMATSRKSADLDDGASISSYETGHEAFEEGEETEHEREPVKPASPPPPPLPAKPIVNGGGDSDLSGSTETAGPPRRRKSVRVSLKPTFSPTPPALDEDDDGYRWDRGGNGDVWQDSSDEDEEYTRAKSMLARLTRKH